MLKSKNGNEVVKLIVTLFVALAIIIGLVIAFGTKKIDESEYTEIKFSDMYDLTGTLKEVSQKLNLLNNKKVLLSGYMAEQSPVDGSFAYLVNQPYVVCPFCTVGDITKLEVMTVIMADGTTIDFRTNAVNIYGTLEVAPKVDSFGYTTQFRILADRIVNIEESDGNAEINNYYQSLNESGMILDLQTLQMNIDSITNPESIMMYYSTNNPIEVIDAIKADTNNDYTYYYDYFVSQWDAMKNDETYDFEAYKLQMQEQGIDIDNITSQQAYVLYIKECPDIIAFADTNQNEKLIALNEELIGIYNKQIPLMEKVMDIVAKIKTKDMTDEEKIETYNALVSFKDENLKYFNEFNNWNNKLRQ